MTEGILQKITVFADAAHGDQQRKYPPERYIAHPVRVMQTCKQYTGELPVLAAALLHDVLEDTPVSAGEIEVFLMTLMPPRTVKRTIQLVIELTDIYTKAAYPQWIRQRRKQMEVKRMAGTSADAQTIKYADILDNSVDILKYDRDFGKRFLKECKEILVRADRGRPELRKHALQVVEDGLSTFKR